MKTFRLSTLLLMPLALFVVTVVPAQAQHWTAAEQELMTAIEECWTLNKEAESQARVEEWADQCWASDELRFWWAEDSSPISTREMRRGVSTGLWQWSYERWDWTGLGPLSINIDGDIALVYFIAHSQSQDTEGKYTFEESRRFEVWKMVDGRWKFLGGMGAPSD